ncbi:hypothetical protein COP2_035826 [Malus domestica]
MPPYLNSQQHIFTSTRGSTTSCSRPNFILFQDLVAVTHMDSNPSKLLNPHQNPNPEENKVSIFAYALIHRAQQRFRGLETAQMMGSRSGF